MRPQKSQNQSRDRVFREHGISRKFRETSGKLGPGSCHSVLREKHNFLKISLRAPCQFQRCFSVLRQNLGNDIKSQKVTPCSRFPGSSGKLTPGTTPCSSLLPCAHDLLQYRREGVPVPLSSIHPQWLTAEGMQPQRPRLLDPLRPPRQYGSAARTTSSGRIMTGNEVAQATYKKPVRYCRNCQQPGHNQSRCTEPCPRCKSNTYRISQCSM